MRAQEAKQTLLKTSPRRCAVIPCISTTSRCYEAQLGNIAECKRQLEICFKMDKNYKAESLNDPDLEPLWRTVES